jgi:hypothetical protein
MNSSEQKEEKKNMKKMWLNLKAHLSTQLEVSKEDSSERDGQEKHNAHNEQKADERMELSPPNRTKDKVQLHKNRSKRDGT